MPDCLTPKIDVLILDQATYRMRFGGLPEKGMKMNIRPDTGPLAPAVYLITFINDSYPLNRGTTFALSVALVAPFADGMFIHEAVKVVDG